MNSLEKQPTLEERSALLIEDDIFCQKVQSHCLSELGYTVEIASDAKTANKKITLTAIDKNKNPIKIPCHRVVKSSGEIGGFARGTKVKIALLKKEGIEIENSKIKDLNSYLYRF